MSHRSGRNCEPYTGYVSHSGMNFVRPQTLFYTKSSEVDCKRFFCATCGDLHATSAHYGQRIMEWITGTTLPDAIQRASEACIIDDTVQGRYQRGSSLPEYLKEREKASLPTASNIGKRNLTNKYL